MRQELVADVANVPEVLTKQTEFTSDTKYAFWILALIQLPAAVILFIVQKKNLVEIPSVEEAVEKNDSVPIELSLDYVKKRFAEIPAKELTFLVSAMVFLFEGLQVLIISILVGVTLR